MSLLFPLLLPLWILFVVVNSFFDVVIINTFALVVDILFAVVVAVFVFIARRKTKQGMFSSEHYVALTNQSRHVKRKQHFTQQLLDQMLAEMLLMDENLTLHSYSVGSGT